MIVPFGAVRVLVATRPVDFRKGMDGLAALVQESLGLLAMSSAAPSISASIASVVLLRAPFGLPAGLPLCPG
jgi:transposase